MSARLDQPRLRFLNELVHIDVVGEFRPQVRPKLAFMRLHFDGKPAVGFGFRRLHRDVEPPPS
jgi:hypothetical protein